MRIEYYRSADRKGHDESHRIELDAEPAMSAGGVSNLTKGLNAGSGALQQYGWRQARQPQRGHESKPRSRVSSLSRGENLLPAAVSHALQHWTEVRRGLQSPLPGVLEESGHFLRRCCWEKAIWLRSLRRELKACASVSRTGALCSGPRMATPGLVAVCRAVTPAHEMKTAARKSRKLTSLAAGMNSRQPPIWTNSDTTMVCHTP